MQKRGIVILKKTLKCLAIFIGVLTLLWCVVVGLVATPEVLTPKVVDVAQKYVRSDVSLKSVDLSLLRDFPNITLSIDSLRITQTKDSIDDLLFARECHVAINPFALLRKRIVVDEVSLVEANMYVYVDSLNGPLKTFILPEQQETQDTATLDVSDYTLTLKRLSVDSTRMVVDDRTKNFYTRVEGFDLDMSMNLSSTLSKLDVKTGFDNLIVWHAGDLLVKKTSLDLSSKMQLDMDSLKLSFEQARLKVNGIDLKAQGTLTRDTLADGIQVDMTSSLSNTSISEFLALIPSSVVDGKDKITTEGSVAFDVEVKGLYSDGSMPTVAARLKMDNAKAKYASRKLSLDNVNCDANIFVDYNNPAASYADVKSLNINTSGIIDLDARGRVDNLLTNAAVDLALHCDIDFDRFSEVFPLNEAVVCSGSNKSDIKAQFTLADIENSNYADLYIDGVSDFKNLELSLDASKFTRDTTTTLANLSMQIDNGSMVFGDRLIAQTDSRTLRSKINFVGLGYRSKAGEYVSIKDVELTVGANFDRRTSRMNGIGARGIAKNTMVGIDSMFSANLESSDIIFTIAPKTEERGAIIKAKINSQHIDAQEPNFNSKLNLSTVDMDLTMLPKPGEEWDMNGTVAFTDFGMFTDVFPLEVKIPDTRVSVDNNTIHLNNAHITLGASEMVATGHISNLLQKLFAGSKSMLSGRLSIQAPVVDFSQIMEVTNNSVLMVESSDLADSVASVDSLMASTDVTVQDSSAMTDTLRSGAADTTAVGSGSGPFLVPRKIDFAFDLNIDKALFEDAVIEDVRGRASLKRGVLTLEELRLKTIGADVLVSANYYNIDRRNSNVTADMVFDGIDISRIGELMPSINSMFPMLKSFEGQVSFDAKINTNLDKNSELDISTLNGAMLFKGKNLVLMDSETFTDLSKTLMFKNKKRNMIDSLEVYALVDESKVDVLPFVMTIDRYAAIIAGSQIIDPQTFDVDYQYNISIMKSPLPFKAGVDVTGNLDDFEYKVTKAKLKKTDFAQQKLIYQEFRDAIDESADALKAEVNAKRRAAIAARKLKAQQAAEAALEADTTEQAADSLVVGGAVADSLAVDEGADVAGSTTGSDAAPAQSAGFTTDSVTPKSDAADDSSEQPEAEDSTPQAAL